MSAPCIESFFQGYCPPLFTVRAFLKTERVRLPPYLPGIFLNLTCGVPVHETANKSVSTLPLYRDIVVYSIKCATMVLSLLGALFHRWHDMCFISLFCNIFVRQFSGFRA
jgi:hypothetical protein